MLTPPQSERRTAQCRMCLNKQQIMTETGLEPSGPFDTGRWRYDTRILWWRHSPETGTEPNMAIVHRPEEVRYPHRVVATLSPRQLGLRPNRVAMRAIPHRPEEVPRYPHRVVATLALRQLGFRPNTGNRVAMRDILHRLPVEVPRYPHRVVATLSPRQLGLRPNRVAMRDILHRPEEVPYPHRVVATLAPRQLGLRPNRVDMRDILHRPPVEVRYPHRVVATPAPRQDSLY